MGWLIGIDRKSFISQLGECECEQVGVVWKNEMDNSKLKANRINRDAAGYRIASTKCMTMSLGRFRA